MSKHYVVFNNLTQRKITVPKFAYYKQGDKNMHQKTKFIIDKF
jgi:hypothetical protein